MDEPIEPDENWKEQVVRDFEERITPHILRHWNRDRIVRFAKHLLGDVCQKCPQHCELKPGHHPGYGWDQVGLTRELIDRIDKYIAQIDVLQRQQDEIALKRFIYESVVTDLKRSLQRRQYRRANASREA